MSNVPRQLAAAISYAGMAVASAQRRRNAREISPHQAINHQSLPFNHLPPAREAPGLGRGRRGALLGVRGT